MATSGAYKNQAFTFNYALPKSSDPTAFFTGPFASGEVTYRLRNGATLGAAVSLTPLPTFPSPSTGPFTVALTSSMMNADEIIIEFIASTSDFATRTVSIVTEPTPADVSEVQQTAVSGVADFKADVSGLATSASIAALNDFDPSADTVANVTTVGSVSGSVGSISGITFPTGFSSLTVSAVADGVWDEAQSGHTTVGTFGYYLDDQISGISGGGGTDWTATEKNQIRYRLGVDGTTAAPSVNSPDLATQASVNNVDTVVDLIKVDTTNIVTDTGTTLPAQISGVETKIDTVDANVDAELVDTGTTIPGTIATVDANVDAILVDTGTTLPATLATIEGKVDTVDTVADAIKVDTASILADTGTDGVVISTAQAQSIADEVLKRSVATGEATAAEHSLATIVLAILESSRSSTTWTIKRTDGTTTHFTKTLTLDANADPVTGIE